MENSLENKMIKIKEFFLHYDKAAIAFSGGVDSAVLLFLAAKYAKTVKAYYVKSEFQPRFELDDAKQVCRDLNVSLEIIETDVLSEESISSNPHNRCFYCKKKLFNTIIKKAAENGFETVLDGTNASDDISDRPGFKALAELNVLSPLRLCGFTKSDIRKIAEEYHLSVYNKPSYACLATRIPFGTVITQDILDKTECAENALMRMGFSDFRVRYYSGDICKLEITEKDFAKLPEMRNTILSALGKYYNSVLLDLKARNCDE